MITKRHADERGHANYGWLDTHHSFSFGEYYDPAHMGYGHLRVLNDDKIAPGAGFPLHPHADMEIFSYVAAGRLAHRDTLGSAAEIHPGKVQLMSAGRGIRHSEFNPSSDESTRLIQVWIGPEQQGLEPNYQELLFQPQDVENRLKLLAAPTNANGAMRIRQQAKIYTARLAPGKVLELPLARGERGWLQIVTGSASLNGTELAAGDGVAVEQEESLRLRASEKTDLLWFAMG